MVDGTGKTIPTSIKYRTLRISDNILYINEQPVLRYKHGLLFFYSFGHYNIKKILTNLNVYDYVIEIDSLYDDAVDRRTYDYINAFVYHTERFNYLQYNVGIKVYYMDDDLFQNYPPRIKYYRQIGPLEYDHARLRYFQRQRRKEQENATFILNGIWKVRQHDF